MVTTIIDLEQIKFDDSEIPLFEGKELELSPKNFIFARNGSGKSTLSKAIYNQKQTEFDVHVFNGFDSLIGENDYLDAFSLAVNASEKEAEIKELEDKITRTEQKLSSVDKLLDKKMVKMKNRLCMMSVQRKEDCLMNMIEKCKIFIRIRPERFH